MWSVTSSQCAASTALISRGGLGSVGEACGPGLEALGDHAGTSSSSTAGERREVGDLAGRLGLGALAEAVDPDRRQAELVRGRDVVEQARPDVHVGQPADLASRTRASGRAAGL